MHVHVCASSRVLRACHGRDRETRRQRAGCGVCVRGVVVWCDNKILNRRKRERQTHTDVSVVLVCSCTLIRVVIYPDVSRFSHAHRTHICVQLHRQLFIRLFHSRFFSTHVHAEWLFLGERCACLLFFFNGTARIRVSPSCWACS